MLGVADVTRQKESESLNHKNVFSTELLTFVMSTESLSQCDL